MKPSPEQMFYYIYAVLHSRNYREAYKEFLKIDFPRIPYPEDQNLFEKLTNLGGRLVEMHLMWHSEEWNTEHGFPIAGSNMVETIRYKDGGVYINRTQYFSNVDEQEWVFMMGSYQPAQKWLKDRKGKKLQADDIVHYEQMLYAIRHTLVIMDEIDEVI